MGITLATAGSMEEASTEVVFVREDSMVEDSTVVVAGMGEGATVRAQT
jgi:hypothetical protein